MLEAYSGDDIPLVVSAVIEDEDGNAPALSGAKWVLGLRREGSRAVALLRRSPEAGGQQGELIVVVDGKDVRATAMIPQAESAKLRGGYEYGLTVEPADGHEKTVWQDTIQILSRVVPAIP